MNTKSLTNCKKAEDIPDSSSKKDLGYSSEVNSCDSGQGITSLPEDISSTILNEKNSVSSLRHELQQTKLALQRKSVECEQLQIIRNKVESELEDLTTSLFEEANKMVYDANFKRHQTEKKLALAEGKIDALETEVDALKSLVLTSTPSNPNPTSHPQLIKKNEGSPLRNILNRNHGTDEKKLKEENKSCSINEFVLSTVNMPSLSVIKHNKEIDRTLYDQVVEWRDGILASNNISESSLSTNFCSCFQPTSETDAQVLPLKDCEMIVQSPLMQRIFAEDMSLCLTFKNQDLSEKVSICIHKNSLSVELAATGDKILMCSLSEIPACCKHRIRLSDSGGWFTISQSSRNQITSVCNFLTYLRYIKQGIVKHNADQVYWEIVRLRLEMTFSRLGFYHEQP